MSEQPLSSSVEPQAATTHLRARESASTSSESPTLQQQGEANAASSVEHETDEPVCRICLSGEEDDESGALLVPCKCSGTARFVHSACLTSWRLADRKNGFYRCGMCGEAYKMRKTVWTSLAGRKATVPLLALFLALLMAATAGFATNPLMRFSERRVLSREKNPPFVLRRAVKEYLFADLVEAGDVLREFSSFYGVLTGDCRFSSPLEPKLVTDPVDTKDKDYTMTITYKRSETKTWCSEVWGYEEDKQRREGLVEGALRVFGHLWQGWTLASLSPTLIGQPVMRFLAFRSALSLVRPAWSSYLSSRTIEETELYGQTIVASVVMGVVHQARSRYKAARVAGRFFSVWQCGLLLIAACTSLWAMTLPVKLVRWIIKNRVAQVENVVLDVRDSGDRLKTE
ncbi:hypothetical protein JCM8547_006600 [Rhodosporidiobolus lusitaniae]